MKRLSVRALIVTLGVTLVALACLQCDKPLPDALLAITITSQPTGGSGINTVSCTFEGNAWRSDGEPGELEEPIVVTTYWQSTHGTYENRTFTWTQHNQTQTFTSSKSAPSGYYLDKPFWFVIKWVDKDGANEETSDTAYCN